MERWHRSKERGKDLRVGSPSAPPAYLESPRRSSEEVPRVPTLPPAKHRKHRRTSGDLGALRREPRARVVIGKHWKHCEAGDACNYCHLPHSPGPKLGKRQRRIVEEMPKADFTRLAFQLEGKVRTMELQGTGHLGKRDAS